MNDHRVIGRPGDQERPRLESAMEQKGMTMKILRSKTSLIIVFLTAVLGLGACQMTGLGPQDAELFKDYKQ